MRAKRETLCLTVRILTTRHTHTAVFALNVISRHGNVRLLVTKDCLAMCCPQVPGRCRAALFLLTVREREKFWVYYKNNPMVLLTYGLIAFLYILIITLFVIVFPKSVPKGLQANINIQTDVSAIKTNISQLKSKLTQLESISSKKTCELAWLQFNGRCYYVSGTKSNWLMGRSTCLRKGGDLVVITSQQEQDFLISVTNNKIFGYWIGLNTIGNASVWKWVDGTDYEKSYKFWKKGEPSGQSKSVKEECSHLGTDGEWSDIQCSVARHFSICEKNPD